MLPQIKKSRMSYLETMLKKESKSKLTVVNDNPSSPSLKYEKFTTEDKNKDQKKKKRHKSQMRTINHLEGSTFGKIGSQTFSQAVKARFIMKNKFGLPKMSEEINFKQPNLGEAKKSMIRDPVRDAETLKEDEIYFKKMIKEKRFKNQTPTLQMLNLGKL